MVSVCPTCDALVYLCGSPISAARTTGWAGPWGEDCTVCAHQAAHKEVHPGPD